MNKIADDRVSEALELQVSDLIQAAALSTAIFPSSAIANALGDGSVEEKKKSLTSFASASKDRLETAWRFYFVTTLLNYLLIVGSFVIATYMTIVGRYNIALYLGGVAGASFFASFLWKPHTRLLLVQSELLRLSAMSASLDALWNAIDAIPDPAIRADLASKAVDRISIPAKALVDRRKKSK